MEINNPIRLILLFSGAMILGSGIYRFFAAGFWASSPFYYRLVTLVMVIIGGSLLLFGIRKRSSDANKEPRA